MFEDESTYLASGALAWEGRGRGMPTHLEPEAWKSLRTPSRSVWTRVRRWDGGGRDMRRASPRVLACAASTDGMNGGRVATTVLALGPDLGCAAFPAAS